MDDNARVRQAVSVLLAQLGLDAISRDDAVDIVEVTRRYRPAVIVLDLVLPTTDGAAAIVRLRDQPDTRTIPVVVISGHEQEVKRVRAMVEAARLVFLSKPFTLAELRAAITRALTPASDISAS